MTSEHDEFWGDEAGWSTSPERDNTNEVPLTLDATPARGIGGKASRMWGSLLSSGSTASRAHGAGTSGAPGNVDHDSALPVEMQVNGKSNDATEDWDVGWSVEPEPVRNSGVDPLLAKFGGAAVVLTLLIPVAIGFRSGSSDQLIEAATAAASSVATTESQIEFPDPVVTTIVSVATSANEPVATTSASSEASASSTEEAPVESVSSDSRAASELSGSTAEADSESGNIASAAEADALAVRVEPECPIEYEVVVGDFWIRIADGAGVPVGDLLALNGASSGTPLYPGSSICLPAGSSTPPPPPAPEVTVPATTSPATTAAPTTAAPAPPTPTAPEDIEKIIRDIWPDHLEERALEIAWRESNYVPTAKNYCCYGLFQMYWDVHKSWLGGIGITSATQLYDPTTNARAAYALYERAGGWGPWGG